MPHVGYLLLLLLLVCSPFLAACSSRVKLKSGKTVRGEKHAHGRDPVPLFLFVWERVKEATALTAQRLAACITSSSWLLCWGRQPLLLTLHFLAPTDFLRRAQQRTDILVSCASGRSGRGQALGQHPIPNTWVNCTTAFLQRFLWHQSVITFLLIAHYLELSADTGIHCFISSHCLVRVYFGSNMWLMTVIGKTEVISYNKFFVRSDREHLVMIFLPGFSHFCQPLKVKLWKGKLNCATCEVLYTVGVVFTQGLQQWLTRGRSI